MKLVVFYTNMLCCRYDGAVAQPEDEDRWAGEDEVAAERDGGSESRTGRPYL